MHYNRIGLKDLAIKYLEKAILQSESKEMGTDLGKANLIECYIYLANLLSNDLLRSWKYLQKAKNLSTTNFLNGI